MMPPTTAVISPSEAGIPDARAIPIDKGSAIRNTTTEGGTSFATALNLSFSAMIPDSFGLHALPRGLSTTGGHVSSIRFHGSELFQPLVGLGPLLEGPLQLGLRLLYLA